MTMITTVILQMNHNDTFTRSVDPRNNMSVDLDMESGLDNGIGNCSAIDFGLVSIH